MASDFRFGIEEEYFVVDATTKTIANEKSAAFFVAAAQRLGSQVRGEMLQSQVEVATMPHTQMASAREELRAMRQSLSAIAAEHGLAILAAGTHPTAIWETAQQSHAERYDGIMADLQMVGQRNMLCGLHVHVELPDADDRIDIMYRMLPYLPLFVALSTSSPFWRSRATGLKGYRLAAYDELPRTGVPELFRRRADFDAYIAALTRAGVIKDSSYVWWALRPSLTHPTLELRAPDCCTRLEDSIAIAALYRALARRLCRHPWVNWDLSPVARAIVVENKWRAQRYGVHGTFVNEAGTGPITVGDMLDQVIDEVMPHAEALECADEVRHCRTIVDAGTSADTQLAIFAEHDDDSASQTGALTAVTHWIAEATLQ